MTSLVFQRVRLIKIIIIQSLIHCNSDTNRNDVQTTNNNFIGIEKDTQEEELKQDLKYYFMDPYMKFKISKNISWKLLVQIFKLILISIQVRLNKTFLLFLYNCKTRKTRCNIMHLISIRIFNIVKCNKILGICELKFLSTIQTACTVYKNTWMFISCMSVAIFLQFSQSLSPIKSRWKLLYYFSILILKFYYVIWCELKFIRLLISFVSSKHQNEKILKSRQRRCWPSTCIESCWRYFCVHFTKFSQSNLELI